MIISHKHKFIFLKTHKTATQSFYNAIKPYLGADDVSLGDQRVADASHNRGKHPSEHRYIDTSLNIDQVFPTGLTGKEMQDKMGNHIPWFIVKQVVGDDIWNNYTKFSIERKPKDRLVSLYYFLERTFAHPTLYRINPNSELIKNNSELIKGHGKTNPDGTRLFYKFADPDMTVLAHDPEGCRRYFEDWVLCQLMCERLPLVEPSTYSAEIVPRERGLLLESNNKNGLQATYMNHDDKPKLHVGNSRYVVCPHVDDNVILFDRQFHNPDASGYGRYLSMEGQCRFLNYGYYHDGAQLQIDHLVPYLDDVSINYNNFFKKYDIDIQFAPGEFWGASLNTESRKDLKKLKPKEWWFQGEKKDIINTHLEQAFGFLNNLL